jgi:hypothetical protein
MAEELYGILFSLYEYNEEKEEDELICEGRGYIFKLFESFEFVDQADSISGDLQFVAHVIKENQLVEYEGEKILIIDEVRIKSGQSDELKAVTTLLEEINNFLEEFGLEYVSFMHEAFYKNDSKASEHEYFNIYKKIGFEHRMDKSSRQYVFFKTLY